MSGHLEQLIGRLPPLYRSGELVRSLLTIPALELEAFDQDLAWVQGERWFDSALDFDDVTRIAALLDFTPEPWQPLREFRAWVHKLRDARVRDGTVTPAALRTYIEEYTREHTRVTGVQSVRVDRFSAPTDGIIPKQPTQLTLVEQPRIERWQRATPTLGTTPLTRFTIVNAGLDPTTPLFLLHGIAGGPERCPVIFHLTSGRGLVFLGELPTGARLTIGLGATGPVALRDGEDVTADLFGLPDAVPGRAWTRAELEAPATIPTLERGENEFWYLPVAHYDEANLDGPMLAMPDLDLVDAKWDEAAFDGALFEQVPRIQLRVGWREREPASFHVSLPAGTMLSPRDELTDALAARERLGYALSKAVDLLRPAGVKATCALRALREVQPATCRLRITQPLRLRDAGSIGADRLRDGGGVFEESDFDGSTFH